MSYSRSDYNFAYIFQPQSLEEDEESKDIEFIDIDEESKHTSNEASDELHAIAASDESTDTEPSDLTWKKLGEWLEVWLMLENSKKEVLYQVYKNLLQKRKIKYKYSNDFEEEEEKSINHFAPYKNGLHFLLHLMYRSSSESAKITRGLLDKFILIIRSMRSFDLLNNDKYDEIPKNAKEIILYDEAVPKFTLHTKYLWATIRQKPMKYPKKDNKDKENNDTEKKTKTKKKRIAKHLHFQIEEEEEEQGEEEEEKKWIDYDEKFKEKFNYQYNELNYGDYTKKQKKLHYFNFIENIALFSLLKPWYQQLDTNFIHYKKNIKPDINRPITTFNQTEFVRMHEIYEKEHVFELANGTVFYKKCLIAPKDEKDKLMYYVDDVQFEYKKQFINLLQHESQETVAATPIEFIKPKYFLVVHQIEKKYINDEEKWCCTEMNKKVPIYPNQATIHSWIRITDVNYSSIITDENNTIILEPPKEQHKLIKKNGMFLWIQWSYDGTIINLNERTINNSLVHVVNNKIGKTNNNIWRMSCTTESTPQRYIVHLLCDQILTLRKGFILWTVSDNLCGFQQRECAGSLAQIICDGKDRYKAQYSVGANNYNKIDGRTFINAEKNGMVYPPKPSNYSTTQIVNLRQFGFQIPYQWKDYLHTIVHKTIHDRIKGKFTKGRKWSIYPAPFITKGTGIGSAPQKMWCDFNGNKLNWNFLRGGISEFFHITSFGMITKLFNYQSKKWNHRHLCALYNCLRNYLYENNDCLKNFKLSNFNKINKENNMAQMYCKWFYMSITIPWLIGWNEGIDDLIQLIRLVGRIATCNTEKERQNLRNYSEPLFKELKEKYAHIVQSPKFRLLKETIDLDLFRYASIAIIEGLYSEHGHQLPKNVKKNRSNHSQKELEDVLKFFSLIGGLIYVVNGGHYGPQLTCALGKKARNLKHPDDETRIHPIVEEFILTSPKFKFNEYNNDGTQDYCEELLNDDNNSNKHLFVTRQSSNSFDYHFWDEIINQNVSSWPELRQYLWNIVLNKQQEQEPMANDIYFSKNIKVDKYDGMIIVDGKKSNQITFKSSKKSWNYWLKIIDDKTDKEKLVNIKRILKFTNCNLNDDNDEINEIFLGYGDMYTINSASYYNDYTDQKEYHYFLDNFDITKKESTKWFRISKKTILETVVVVHKHIQNENIHHSINYKCCANKCHCNEMSKYYDTIKHQQNESSIDTIPCGPILKCIKHETIYPCNICVNVNHNYTQKWYCNTNTKHCGESIYLIWDAKNGWLPGIWFNVNKKKLINKQYVH